MGKGESEGEIDTFVEREREREREWGGGEREKTFQHLLILTEFNDWNKAEVERLKEGLRKFGRVWGKISRQSGVNKSAKQCKEYFNTHCAIENVGLLQAVADHVMKTAIHVSKSCTCKHVRQQCTCTCMYNV